MTKPDENEANTITFHFEKSGQYRVVHVDGAHGGPTPSGGFHAAFYSERAPLPKSITHELRADGTLGDQVDRVSRGGVFREVEVSLVMSFETLKSIHRWMESHIKRLDVTGAGPESGGEPS